MTPETWHTIENLVPGACLLVVLFTRPGWLRRLWDEWKRYRYDRRMGR